MTFKYNLSRVSITLQKKIKFYSKGVRHEKKSTSKTPCLLDWLGRKTLIFFEYAYMGKYIHKFWKSDQFAIEWYIKIYIYDLIKNLKKKK